MEAQQLFYIILGIYIFNFILGRVVSFLESTTLSKKVPEEVKEFYDSEKYAKQQAYKKESLRFGLITSLVSFSVTLVILLSGAIPWYDDWVNSQFEHPILRALLFFGAAGLLFDLLGTPFSLYHTFVIEERYGFNKTTPATFIKDKLKTYVLGGLLGGGLLALIMVLYMELTDYFWILAYGVIAFILIFLAMFYSHIFLPLFNKLKPLEDESLNQDIKTYAEKVGFKVGNIFEMDGSKRTTKANAFFSGFGPSKRIVLYDTLVKEYKNEEIVAVLAHEVGHNKHKHTLTGLIASLIQLGAIMYVFGLVIDQPIFAQCLGIEQPSFHVNMIVFAMLFSPISLVTGILMNVWSRRNEYQADSYSARTYQGEALVNALKKLSIDSLSNLKPHPVNVFLNYSHPPVLKRIEAIRKVETGQGLEEVKV